MHAHACTRFPSGRGCGQGHGANRAGSIGCGEEFLLSRTVIPGSIAQSLLFRSPVMTKSSRASPGAVERREVGSQVGEGAFGHVRWPVVGSARSWQRPRGHIRFWPRLN